MSGLIRVMAFAACISAVLAGAAGADYPGVLWWGNYGGTQWEQAYSVEQAMDGGFIFAGVTTSYGDANGDVYIVKTDDEGSEAWAKVYGGVGTADLAAQVKRLVSGDYVVVGYTESYGAGARDAYFMKLDSDGDTLWTQTYGGGAIDDGRAVCLISGGYCVAGYTYNFGAVLSDVLIVRTDSDGNAAWTRAHGGPDYEYGSAVCTTSDGAFLVAGGVMPSGGGYEDVYLVKVDAGGSKVWEKKYGGSASDYANDVCRTHDGNYMVVGTTESYGAGGSDMYVLKINNSGDTLWTRTFGGTGWDGGLSVTHTYDHHYVIGGYYGVSDTDLNLVKIDASGNLIWSCRYGWGAGNEEAWSVFETNNAGYIVAGCADSFGNGMQAILMRTTGAFPLLSGVEDIPSDQGKQVRVSWYQTWYDDQYASVEITDYSIWRKINPALSVSGQPGVDYGAGFVRLGFPPGDWDYVTTVPARGEWEYNCVVPTLCDSTADGQCMSYFFVSAETADPHEYYDSPVDSGYSVDNLAPSPPEGLHMATATDLAWEEAPEEDFDYFTVYGSDDDDFGGSVFIGYTIGITLDVSSDPYAYYHVTATDFAGNEGEPATAENDFADVGDGAISVVYALRQNRPNPFGASTSIAFEMPARSHVSLEVLDVNGRVVRILMSETRPAGRYSADWDGLDAVGSEVGPGIYFVRMKAGEFAATRKMLLLR